MIPVSKLVRLLVAFFFRPVSVFLSKGVGKDLFINIILCIFFYLPGSLHALWFELK